MTPYWTLVITQANKERLAVQNLVNQGYEYYLPLYRERTVKGDVAKVLFSKYLFVKIQRQWASITGTYGVSGLVMDGIKPRKVPESVLEKLKAREDTDGFVILDEKDELKQGSTVRFSSGPLSDTIGIYQGMDVDERALVLFQMLGSERQVRVNPKILIAV